MGKIYDALEKAGSPADKQGAKQPSVHVPTVHRAKADRIVPFAAAYGAAAANGLDKKLIAFHNRQSVESELFKVLRTNLLFPLKGKPPKSVLVTSAIAGEGKSFISSNLAISIACGIEEHVLLIDADLRNPSINRYFGFERSAALAQYLTGDADVSQYLVKTPVDKLTILPAGTPPDNPTELLTALKMKALLEEAKSRYPDRFLIIDSAPLSFAPETAAIANYVDAVLFVIKAGSTPRRAVIQVIEQVGKEKIIGFVLNQADHSGKKYYGYSKYYYRNKAKQTV